MTMQVTHVVRGDDHLNNTPKQIQLYEALGVEPPMFAHAPLILGPDKKRLSKRHGATNVMQYGDDGYLPDAMINFLVRLGWSHGDQEVFTRDELCEFFSLESVGRSPGVWNPEKLEWLNGQYITALSNEKLAELIAPRIQAANYPDASPDAEMAQRIGTLKERARTLVELVEQGSFYWRAGDDVTYEGKPRRKFLGSASLPNLEAALSALTQLHEWNEESLETCLQAVLEVLEVKMGKLAQPIRVAVTGTSVSPGLYETLAALGREKTLQRISMAVAVAKEAASAQEPTQ
jgi:glutamyl-tRNA synthetase